MSKEKMHYILPQKVYKYEDGYYAKRPFFMNELSNHFFLKIYADIEEKKSIDNERFVRFEEEIKFQDFFEGLGLKHFLKNISKYRNKILSLPEQELYFMHHPTKISPLFSIFLRNRKLVIWFKGNIIDRYKNNLTKIYGFSRDLIKELLKAPLKLMGWILIPKLIFNKNLVFYTSNAAINKDNHHNQYEIISCSPFNRDDDIIKDDLTKNICFIGSEKGHKGLHVLLKALNYKWLKENITLNIIGISEIKKKRNRKHLEGIDCKLHGEIYERDLFYELLSQNDMLVMPSFGEKQGKVQLEAMSAGVVPICSDSGGTYMTVKNYYNGILFKEGNYKDLRNKILHLYSDKNLYRKLKENGLNYIKNLSLEEQVKKMSKIIKNFSWKNETGILCDGK